MLCNESSHDRITWLRHNFEAGFDSQDAVLEDASLLYAFSTEHRHIGSTEQDEIPLCALEDDNIQVDDDALKDTPETGGQDVSPLLLARHSISSINSSSPLLTFQADILPNIPRELPYPSTWWQSPTSDRRFYLQYCKQTQSAHRGDNSLT